MLKLVATISDFGAAANIGGNVQYNSEIIEIPTRSIPPRLREYLEKESTRRWQTVQFSLLFEADNG